MKTISTIILIMIFWCPLMHAQEGQELFSRGYNSNAEFIDRFQDNTWMLLTKHSPYSGGIYQDTITAFHVDSTGKLLHEIDLTPPKDFENYTIEQFITMPDGSFVTCYSGGDCDAGGYGYYLEKRDTTGDLRWLIEMPMHGYPYTMALSKDSNLLIANEDFIIKYASGNAQIMWEVEIDIDNAYFIRFLPGTEDFISTGYYGLNYFKQDTQSGEIQYVLEHHRPHDSNQHIFTSFFMDENGQCYAYQHQQDKIIRFGTDLIPAFFASFDDSAVDFEAANNGVYVLIRDDFNSTKLVFIDSSGHHHLAHDFAGKGIRPEHIYLLPEGLALFGHYGSGPEVYYFPGFPYVSRGQAWFKYFPQYQITAPPSDPDIAVTRIHQRTPISYTSFWSPGPMPADLHNFQGGDFEIQITNHGNIPVHDCWLNIAFRENVNIWFCSSFSTQQILVHTNGLLPGDSLWVDFGDIEAIHQLYIPDQFCFWTSGPNYFPDRVPENDAFCMDRIVATEDVSKENISLFPNPASDQLFIKCNADQYLSSDWSITDMFGRTVLTGRADELQNENYISVITLSSGVYIFNMGSFSEKIIISR